MWDESNYIHRLDGSLTSLGSSMGYLFQLIIYLEIQFWGTISNAKHRATNLSLIDIDYLKEIY